MLNEENLDKIEKFFNVSIMNYKQKYYASEPALRDKIDHITRVTEIVNKNWQNNKIARIAAKAHDIGRFPQYEILGEFNDGKVLHHYLGEDWITRQIYKGNIESNKELDIIRTVIKYHGREKYMPFHDNIPEEAKETLDVISRVDEIENGCIGAVGYLVREEEEDAKGYKKNNPDLDMKSVSPQVLEFFKKGEKFDKMSYCKTYAEYTLFAATLAIQALKGKDRELALDAMKSYKCTRRTIQADGKERYIEYENAIKGYEDIFNILLNSKDKEIAMQVLNGFYNDKNYIYEDNMIRAKWNDEQEKL